MSLRTAMIQICRVVIAGCLALAVLSAFCVLYSNPAIHYTSKDGETDYVWEAHRVVVQGSEGFSWNKTNNDGHFNAADYSEGEQIDVLIMGGSHMEAGNVMTSESTASRLSALLGDKTVYNIATSGHGFPNCFQNLPAALQKYKPQGYVIIEIATPSFDAEELRQALDGTLAEIPSYTGGLVEILQRSPFLRLIYHQLKNFLAKPTADGGEEAAQTGMHEDLLARMLHRIAQETAPYGAKPIILYHPQTKLTSEGDLELEQSAADVNTFASLCQQNGVLFLDMSERFRAEYEQNHILPYGFSNTAVGKGHFNKYGHAMIADELYKMMESAA